MKVLNAPNIKNSYFFFHQALIQILKILNFLPLIPNSDEGGQPTPTPIPGCWNRVKSCIILICMFDYILSTNFFLPLKKCFGAALHLQNKRLALRRLHCFTVTCIYYPLPCLDYITNLVSVALYKSASKVELNHSDSHRLRVWSPHSRPLKVIKAELLSGEVKTQQGNIFETSHLWFLIAPKSYIKINAYRRGCVV